MPTEHFRLFLLAPDHILCNNGPQICQEFNIIRLLMSHNHQPRAWFFVEVYHCSWGWLETSSNRWEYAGIYFLVGTGTEASVRKRQTGTSSRTVAIEALGEGGVCIWQEASLTIYQHELARGP